MIKFEVVDIVAIIIVVGCLILLGKGIDGEIKAFLGFIVGYYFQRAKTGVVNKLKKNPTLEVRHKLSRKRFIGKIKE